jgi:hypothetical protein
MLRIAAMRNGLDLLQTEQSKQDAVFELTPNTHLKWVLPDFSHQAKPEDRCFGDPEREGGMLGKPEKRFSGWTGNHGVLGYDPDDNNAWYTQGGTGHRQVGPSSKPQGSAPNSQAGKGEGQAKPNSNQVIGFEGEIVDKQFVKALLENGCDWCGEEMKPNDVYGWLDDMSVCCSKCLRGEHFHVNVKEGTLVDRVLSIVKGGRA